MQKDVKEDPYRLRAATLFNVKPENVTNEQRQFAKQQMYVEIYSNPIPFRDTIPRDHVGLGSAIPVVGDHEKS